LSLAIGMEKSNIRASGISYIEIPESEKHLFLVVPKEQGFSYVCTVSIFGKCTVAFLPQSSHLISNILFWGV
jgi:hypothetical protein